MTDRRGIPGTGPLRSKALVLYDGTRTAHRSCGVALAETFGRAPQAYLALRRGGVTGKGTCGAVVAGRLVLGELLSAPEPTAPVTERLRRAMAIYERRVDQELDRGTAPDLVCEHLTAPHGEFRGPARHAFCTRLVGQIAQLVDDILRAEGVTVAATPVALDDGRLFDPARDPAPPIGAPDTAPTD